MSRSPLPDIVGPPSIFFRFLLPLLSPFFILPAPSLAHFSLTFPQARYPPFDFLDTRRTVGPCGVPKSARSQITHFQTETPYNLSWRMAMKPKGIFRLHLMDSAGRTLVNGGILRPNGTILNGFPAEDTQSMEERFPAECRNCTLVMELAKESSSPAERACAEVDIARSLAEKPCSGNGKLLNKGEGTACKCERSYSGEQCQHRDDCEEDADCGPGGRCLTDAVQRGQRSCFCQFGRFGSNCEKSSDPHPNDLACFAHNGPFGSGTDSNSSQFLHGLFNPNCYSSKVLNTDGDTLYWRLVGDQLELVLDFHTNSWLALGWRPLNIPPSCRLFPQMRPPLGAPDGDNPADGLAMDVLEWPLHPMDCADMVMASVRDGTLLHISDQYSRDLSTPLKDEWLDGEQSLSSAYGMALDQRMVVMFRRMVPEIEPTDHPLGPGELFVIWAKGQPRRDDGAFYSDGQWKYHGNGRGHLKAEFVTPQQMAKVRGPLVHLEPVGEGTTEQKGGGKKKGMMVGTTTTEEPRRETEAEMKTEEPRRETEAEMKTEEPRRETEADKTEMERRIGGTEAETETRNGITETEVTTTTSMMTEAEGTRNNNILEEKEPDEPKKKGKEEDEEEEEDDEEEGKNMDEEDREDEEEEEAEDEDKYRDRNNNALRRLIISSASASTMSNALVVPFFAVVLLHFILLQLQFLHTQI